MKRFVWLILAALGLAAQAGAETIFVQGDISGIWSADSIIVAGDVRVPPNLSLTIEPGVQVLFQGLYKFNVEQNATLTAIGTAEEWICFNGINSWTEWHGFHFNAAASASHLEFCLIHGAMASGSLSDWDGGGIRCYQTDLTVQNCIFNDCRSDNDGGAIWCQLCNPIITNNLFMENRASYNGGAIYVGGAAPILSGNIFISNTADWYYGGAVSCWGNLPFTIQNNIFAGNAAGIPAEGGSGGAIGCVGNSADIIGNVLVQNEATWMGGAIFCQSSGSLIKDNIIYGNATIGENAGVGVGNGGGIGLDELDDITVTGNLICSNSSTSEAGGVWAGDIMRLILDRNTITNNSADNSTGGVFGAYRSQMTDNIIWGNSGNQIYQSPVTQVFAAYCDVQGGWIGTGNINEDPLFVDTGFQDYRLLWDSPCIDSGDPDSTDSDGTRADMGAFYYDQSVPVRMLLTPHQMPYLIPESGGWMDYTIRAYNRDSQSHNVTVWCNVTLPSGATYGPVLGPVNVTVGSELGLERQRAQYVPAAAPMGVYHYNAYAVVAADTSLDSFMFGKTDNGGNYPRIAGTWNNIGEALLEVPPSEQVAQSAGEDIPAKFALAAPSPNPFNASTAISYQLSADSEVSLQIYDTAGRLVASLVNGWRKAGSHEVAFDAADLPSGMYLCRLQAGEFQAVQKLALLK